MRNILNITNGDSAVDIMKQAAIPGDYLPWRDVLHDGPVPGKTSFAELSRIRARFLARCGWGELTEIQRNFDDRNELLANAGEYGKVIMWFEHDLYDQLQLLQILDYLHRHAKPTVEYTMVCTENYLGMQSPEQMTGLLAHEKPVTRSQFSLGSHAWSAFRSATPERWYRLLETDTRELPFLRNAVIRQLEEYPNCDNGLSRTARQVLTLLSTGHQKPGKLFAANQQLEGSVFLGDAGFFLILNELIQADPPLLSLNEGNGISFPINRGQILSITTAGLKVLNGQSSWFEQAEINRWIGGVHLSPGNTWCWNAKTKSISKYT